MKTPALVTLFTALALCGCVASRTIVGSKVPELKPEVWNAKWIDGYGDVITTRIKDGGLGIVEVMAPDHKRGRQTSDIYLRTLGPALLIANQKSKPDDGTWQFGRISINQQSLVVFPSFTPAFVDLINQHRLAGRIIKDKKGKPTNSCTIDGFSDRDCARLQKQGVDVLRLFYPDPDTVLVRRHPWPDWHRILNIPDSPRKKSPPGPTLGGWNN